MKIGVVLPLMGDEETGQVVRYADTRAFARQAEAAGFDSVWIFDHVLYRYPEKPTQGPWEAWTVISALAEATTRVDLGTLVVCTPLRNPAVLAKMAVTLDEVSDGRLILGLGTGWHRPEFDAFGIPFDHRVDRFEEALRIIVPLLREGKVSFQGKHYSAVDCEILPRGPRPSGPPILIAASGPRMLRLTARYANSWNTAWYGQPDALGEAHAGLEAACSLEGRDPATLEVTVGVNVDYSGGAGESFRRPPLSG
ncbi:MAG TPA: LLM class flavin-dependent oxidoreductase, partial [Chloroflexota bacterium]|nr:LLM class flavin-dependent oxidoreductase [Chloroflexota bacterium]